MSTCSEAMNEESTFSQVDRELIHTQVKHNIMFYTCHHIVVVQQLEASPWPMGMPIENSWRALISRHVSEIVFGGFWACAPGC